MLKNETLVNTTSTQYISHKFIFSSFIIQFLGYFITLISFTFKLPQIYMIIKAKSTNGLSTISNYFDFFSILFQGLYSLHKELSPVIYLEYFSTTFQNITIIFLSWYYADKKLSFFNLLGRIFFITITVYIIILSSINKGKYINEYIWNLMVFFGMPFMSISRISQMKVIYETKSVGAVSLESFALRAGKNFLKVIVILYESANLPLIINQFYYGLLTLGVIFLILKYRKKESKKHEIKIAF